MKHLKLYEEYEDSIEDFENLKEGDILIAKDDIYVKYPKGAEINYKSPIICFYGDKLFMKKGRTKKVKIYKYGTGFYLSGFPGLISTEKLKKYFTIKNGELLNIANKFNL